MIASQRATPGGGDAAIVHCCHHRMGAGHLVRSLAVAGALAGRNRGCVLRWAGASRAGHPGGAEIVAVPPLGTGPDGSLVSHDRGRALEEAVARRAGRLLRCIDEVNTPKLVCSAGETSLTEPAGLCATFVEQVMPVSRPCAAELAKLAGSTFRHVTVALVNELVMFARELGSASG